MSLSHTERDRGGNVNFKLQMNFFRKHANKVATESVWQTVWFYADTNTADIIAALWNQAVASTASFLSWNSISEGFSFN